MWVSDQLHAPAASPTKETNQYPLNRSMNGPQSRYEQEKKKKKAIALAGI
jgi:hypothetical protein